MSVFVLQVRSASPACCSVRVCCGWGPARVSLSHSPCQLWRGSQRSQVSTENNSLHTHRLEYLLINPSMDVWVKSAVNTSSGNPTPTARSSQRTNTGTYFWVFQWHKRCISTKLNSKIQVTLRELKSVKCCTKTALHCAYSNKWFWSFKFSEL